MQEKVKKRPGESQAMVLQPRCRWMAMWLFGFVMSLGSSAANAANALYGLADRPTNLTCVAPERPIIVTGTSIQQALPNLSFRTVPDQPSSQFLNGVIDMQQIPGDNSQWFVVERAGKIHQVANDDSATSFNTVLDISAHFSGIQYFEQWGINSIAFHPDFASNGQLYVLYNDRSGSTYFAVLARFTSIDGGTSFDPASEEILLSVTDNQTYHHFGDVHFGPDGFLYASLGSPSFGDGQNVDDLHGALLRLDVDAPFPYAIPADNPFASGGGEAEIFAWGLRNPWRFSFDKFTGDIWLGDVGENQAEEINRIVSGGNYGWNISEGSSCSGAACASVILPELSYSHSEGKAITGGYVYRGTAIPELIGRYVFADSFSGEKIWALTYDVNGDADGKEVLIDPLRVTGFAQDQLGELLAIDLIDSMVYRLLPGIQSGGLPPGFPQWLSETGCFDAANPTQPVGGLIPYTVHAELWSDGAAKRRWLGLPDGQTITVDADGDFEFPVGTVLIKEFSFHDNPVETRLFMRHPDGVWAGYSYEWASDLSDAALLSDGKSTIIDESLVWQFPSPSQCLQCHLPANKFALGPEIGQLNGQFTYPSTGDTANQISTLEHIGLFRNALSGPAGEQIALAALLDLSRPIATRARSYLHSNCAGCHRPGGTSQSNLDLRFTTAVDAMNACSEPPQHGDLGVSGSQLLYPGSPSQSVISLRMHALDANRMPPLATSLGDAVGMAVVDTWISSADVCNVSPDSDADGSADNLDNCINLANASQLDSDSDGYGNVCDSDLNNDCVVNTIDIGRLKQQFFDIGPGSGDLNADGVVNSLDLGVLKTLFFSTPGPSALSNVCGP